MRIILGGIDHGLSAKEDVTAQCDELGDWAIGRT